MQYLAWLAVTASLAACNTDGAPAPKVDASPVEPRDETRSVVDVRSLVSVSASARDGEPRERFSSKEDVFLTALPAAVGATLPRARDYFFRVVDARGEDVSRSDSACRRVRIGETGRIEVLYAAGEAACLHSTAKDRTDDEGGVTVGLAPFGDAAAILDGEAIYEVQLAPVERFTGFDEPTFAASFILDLRVAAK